MEKIKLIDICNPKQWKTIATGQLSKQGDFPVYGANGIIGFYKEFNHEDQTVLITCRGATCGNVHISLPKSYINGNAMALDNLDESVCLKEYLYYFLSYYDMSKIISGTAQPQITIQGLKKINVKICPIEEQKNIIDKLNIVKKIIKIKKEQIIDLDNIIKSQFVEMFGDIKDTKYKVMKLEELTNLITDGEHKKPNYTEYGKPFISVVNITTGDLKFDNCKFVSAEDSLKFQKRCKPERNDILYTKVGATYGRSAIVNTDREFSLYVSVCLIKPKSELINPIFLNYTMRQPYVKIQADKCIKGIGVPDLHLIEIKKFNIIVPPIELQNQFAEIVKQIDKQKFESEIELRKLQKNIFYKWGR